MAEKVTDSYSQRASEYVAKLGSVGDMNPLDVALITTWGQGVAGPILDAGSGPGHWTDLLQNLGCDTHGIDMVPEFVDSARKRFPLTAFDLGDILDLPFDASSFGGVLAWYSLIHMRPKARELTFREFARVLKPGGELLVGAFLGQQDLPFDHAITEAFYWSEDGLTDHLRSAGFQVVATQIRSSENTRPHVSVQARLS